RETVGADFASLSLEISLSSHELDFASRERERRNVARLEASRVSAEDLRDRVAVGDRELELFFRQQSVEEAARDVEGDLPVDVALVERDGRRTERRGPRAVVSLRRDVQRDRRRVLIWRIRQTGEHWVWKRARDSALRRRGINCRAAHEHVR